ncbi:MAG: nucleoside-binding protein [Pseudomonadota bacterium]
MRIQLLILATLFLAAPVKGEILWQDFSATYLYGEDYRVGDNQREVITFEHAAGASWGDSFFFLDHLRSRDGSKENYAEWSPRLSSCKFGLYCSDSNEPLGDILFASTVEMSEQSTHFLHGIGVDLNIDGFSYLQLNTYRRFNDGVEDNWQLTATWAYPFDFEQQSFLYDGFIDWFSGTQNQRASLNWTSQLKWDAGKAIGLDNRLYLGIEYVYWRNKFGIADTLDFPTHESNVNLLIKYHF